MRNVMSNKTKSRRHDLFLDKKERERCSGSETSRLYQLSNPGFLGGGGEKDTVVIKQLIDTVFMKYFHEADPRLRRIGNSKAFIYTSCVLFPETFIHQLKVTLHVTISLLSKFNRFLQLNIHISYSDVWEEQGGG